MNWLAATGTGHSQNPGMSHDGVGIREFRLDREFNQNDPTNRAACRYDKPTGEPMSRDEDLKVLRLHKGIVSQRFGVTDLALFGSTGRNQATDSNEIDILVRSALSFTWRICWVVPSIWSLKRTCVQRCALTWSRRWSVSSLSDQVCWHYFPDVEQNQEHVGDQLK